MLNAVESRLERQFTVKSVMDFAAIDKNPPTRQETLYVLPLGERTKNTEYTGQTVSRVTYQFGVVTALRNLRGERPAELDGTRKKIRTSLLSWVPETGFEPITRGAGRLLQFKDNTVYWLDIFETKNTEQVSHHS